ncbi:hypothetical protein [Bacillus sp. FJAT-22090]|uniref:hypothetical protein n=1 Tax=Bacillus sp. FJAT-22090 TaxID=1581038 RepID=UPI0011A05509|nr:hypothetical protein [Bacillus sp. FJAT-22090]
MRKELKEKITEENKYYDLLTNNPQYRLQGYSMEQKKVIVGIIKGNPKEYKQEMDHLSFEYFDTWKEAYLQLS